MLQSKSFGKHVCRLKFVGPAAHPPPCSFVHCKSLPHWFGINCKRRLFSHFAINIVFLTLQRNRMRIRFQENLVKCGDGAVECISERIAFQESRSKGKKLIKNNINKSHRKHSLAKRKKCGFIIGMLQIRSNYFFFLLFCVYFLGLHTHFIGFALFSDISMRCVFRLHRRIKQEAGKKNWQKRIFQMK